MTFTPGQQGLHFDFGFYHTHAVNITGSSEMDVILFVLNQTLHHTASRNIEFFFPTVSPLCLKVDVSNWLGHPGPESQPGLLSDGHTGQRVTMSQACKQVSELSQLHQGGNPF